MGVGAVPLLLAGASTAASAINTRRTERRQDRALADKIRNQGRKQREADARVNAEIDSMAGSSGRADRSAALSEYVAQVAANRNNMNALGEQRGNVSDAYAQAARDASLGAAAETDARAGLMAVQDGAGRMRDREARNQVRLGGDLGLIRREADGQAYLDDMRVRSIRRNPWLDAAAAVLGGMAASGIGAGTGAASGRVATALGMGSPAGIGAGLAGGTRYAPPPAVFDPFARYGRGGGR